MTQQTRRITLSGELGLRDADGVREQLLDAFCAQMAVEVEAEDLTALDMSIVQVLLAAHKMAKGRGQTFQVIAAAEGPLQDALSRAGLLAQSADAPFEISWRGRAAAS